MKDLLPCCLFRVGTKFVVTPDVKETTFPPGTTAFMSSMLNPDMDYQDVASVRAVVIRRGKGGKARVNINSMHIPIFSDPRMLEHDNYLPVGRRYYVHIDKEPAEEIDVMEMDEMDFLGWACAKSWHLRHLATKIARKGSGRLWPSSKKEPVVAAYSFNERFEIDEAATLANFTNGAFRTDFVRTMRVLEATLSKCETEYQRKVAAAALNSSKFMVYTNEKYFKVVDEDLAKKTVDFYSRKLKWLDSMSVQAFRKKKAKSQS
jgi:hypothetical protein